jgi:hypothetical protein
VAKRFIFADEAGCLGFSRKQNVSRYFILCTIILDDCSLGGALLDLRRELAWEGSALDDYFHASEDRQAIRDRVYSLLAQAPFSIQATIMEQSKALPHIAKAISTFYQYGWFYHFKHGIRQQLGSSDETLVTAASIGTKKERTVFRDSVGSALRQTLPANAWKMEFIPSSAEPCLQIADYCAWAIQRKYERSDTRSYDLIKDRITYEYDLWARGSRHFY